MKRIIKAYDELIIVKQKVVEKTASGIILTPDTTRMGSMECFEGVIVAIGDKVKKFKQGDWVLFGRNVFASMKRDGIEFLLMFERDVNCTERSLPDDYILNQNECEVCEVSYGE